MTVDEMYDMLLELADVTKEALDLAFGIAGYTEETAEKILYWYTGYTNFENFNDEEWEEE